MDVDMRLPPLNALPDFEAAGRLLSFTRAAQELNVTHGAVSRQVKALEDHLGVPLFRRLTRRIVLTEEGRTLLPVVARILAELAAASARMKERGRGGRFNISASFSFATKWLVPRLHRFREAHSDLDLHLEVSDSVADFATEDVDVAIRYGTGRYPGLVAERVMGEYVSPVCSPKRVGGRRPPRCPSDLARHALLHEDRMREDWPRWLAAMGVEGVDASRGPRYSHGSMMIEAAIRGEGIALGRSVLVGDDLAAGRLIEPFPAARLPVERGYDFVYVSGALERPIVRAFRDWLFAEAAGESLSKP